jgi:Tfp pilus assembly protein PilF
MRLNRQNINGKKTLILLFFIGFILYGKTLFNNYALDDAIVITQNTFTKQGIKGIPYILQYDSFTGFFGKEKQLVAGGRYRPLSIITFAIEYQLFGENPLISHFINILIYIFISFLIYKLILLLLQNQKNENLKIPIAILTSLLFLIHPVHTEVVANIKGRDELLSLFFSLLAFLYSYKFLISKKSKNLIFSFIWLFLGLMSKENAITFVAVIPVAVWFFTNEKLKTIVKITIPLLVASTVFLIIRNNVLGGFNTVTSNELMNNPFLNASTSQKFATIFYTWLIYLKLLIFPHPLTYDYYPYHIEHVDFSNIFVILSIAILIFLISVFLVGIKRKSIISFSIFAFAATFLPVSNLLFSVGTFMNERFIFIPSLFFCLSVIYLSVKYFYETAFSKGIVIILTIYTIIFFPVKTISRNSAWKNDYTLFTTDVKISSNSAKGNCSVGGKLWEKGKSESGKQKQKILYNRAEGYLKKSIEIYPDYADALLLLGNVLFDNHKDIAGAADCYLKVLQMQNANQNAWKNIDIVLQNSNNRNLQLKYYLQLEKVNNNNYTVNYRLGVLYGRYFNQMDKSIFYLEKAHKISPNKVEAIKDLGTACGIKGLEEKAYYMLKKALKLDTTDVQIYINLGIAASKKGYKNEAQQYFSQAEKLKSINQ